MQGKPQNPAGKPAMPASDARAFPKEEGQPDSCPSILTPARGYALRFLRRYSASTSAAPAASQMAASVMSPVFGESVLDV